jgi:hypothetical protein
MSGSGIDRYQIEAITNHPCRMAKQVHRHMGIDWKTEFTPQKQIVKN